MEKARRYLKDSKMKLDKLLKLVVFFFVALFIALVYLQYKISQYIIVAVNLYKKMVPSNQEIMISILKYGTVNETVILKEEFKKPADVTGVARNLQGRINFVKIVAQ